VLILAGLGAAAAVVAFVLAHIVLLAVCAAVWCTVMGSVAAWFRWLSSPRRLQAHLQRPTVKVLPSSATQAISARQRAIESPRALPPRAAVNREPARRVP
jgi:hypothetical protein